MRFELIDRVLERGQDRLVAVKCVTAAEEYLADHFPTFPVLPGVMMLEAMVQAGRLLVEGQSAAEGHASAESPSAGWPLVVSEVRNVRYGTMVRPGQSLKVEVTLRGRNGEAWDLNGTGSVDDQVAVQGRFKLARLVPPFAKTVEPRMNTDKHG